MIALSQYSNINIHQQLNLTKVAPALPSSQPLGPLQSRVTEMKDSLDHPFQSIKSCKQFDPSAGTLCGNGLEKRAKPITVFLQVKAQQLLASQIFFFFHSKHKVQTHRFHQNGLSMPVLPMAQECGQVK